VESWECMERNLSGLGFGVMGGVEHGASERGVDGGPSGADFFGEGGAEALFESPEERGADGGVVSVVDAETGVADAEIADGGENLIEFLEAAHREAEDGHELPTLLLHVAAEESTESGIELEETGVKKCRGLIGDGSDGTERVLNEDDFTGIHGGWQKLRVEG
jgi:hypothetical protein